MAASIDKIIKIFTDVITNTSNNTSLITNVLTKYEYIPNNSTNRTLSYTNPSDVALFFGNDSDEYKFAIKYFAGYKNQDGVPPMLLFSRYINTKIGAWISSGYSITNKLINTFKTITNGAITFKFNNSTQSITNIDLSGITTLSDVANILQTALSGILTGATVSYDGVRHQFYCRLPAGDGTTAVDYCDTSDLSTLLGFIKQKNAILSQGSDEQDEYNNMENIIKNNNKFIAFTTIWDSNTSVSQTEALCDYTSNLDESRKLLYAPYTSTSIENAILIKQMIDEGQYINIFLNYSKYDFVAGQLGALASVDYNGTKSIIALSNKQFIGVIPLVTNDADFDNLKSKKINFYADISSRTDISGNDVNSAIDGSITGDLDNATSFFNKIAINSSIQTALFNIMQKYKVMDYDEFTYNLLTSMIKYQAELKRNAGAISNGRDLSYEKINQLNVLYPKTSIIEDIITKGYFVHVIPPTADDKLARLLRIDFVYSDSGYIGTINLHVTIIKK